MSIHLIAPTLRSSLLPIDREKGFPPYSRSLQLACVVSVLTIHYLVLRRAVGSFCHWFGTLQSSSIPSGSTLIPSSTDCAFLPHFFIISISYSTSYIDGSLFDHVCQSQPSTSRQLGPLFRFGPNLHAFFYSLLASYELPPQILKQQPCLLQFQHSRAQEKKKFSTC